jgi:hypothetical protein
VTYGWFMNGFFDTPIIGAPLFFWIGVAWFVMNVLVGIWVIYVWYWVMNPVRGYFSAAWNHKPMGRLVSKTRKVKLITLEYLAKIYQNTGLSLAWILTSDTAVMNWGGVPTLDVFDDWGIAEDVNLDSAIKILADDWNEREEKRELAGKDDRRDLIVTNKDFDRHLLAGDFDQICKDHKVVLPPLRIIDLEQIKRYRAHEKMDASAHYGFIQSEVARAKADEIKKSNTALWLGIGVMGFILVSSILGYFFLSSAHCH